MDLLRQTNSAFPQEVRRYGCRFMSMLAIPQLYIGKPLDVSQIETIYHVGKSDPLVIGENCRTGKNEHVLMQHALALLGRPTLRCRQVGKIKGETVVFWNSSGPYQYIVGHWETLGLDGHWTLFDPNGIEIYDPWEPREAKGIEGLEDGYVIRKQVVDKRLLYRIWETITP